MVLRITLIAGLSLFAANAHAQFWKSGKAKGKSEGTVQRQQPTSLNPSSAERREYEPKAARKATQGPTYDLEQAYYERMEALQKERRKTEKMMEKPQYSDPMYFGHKRPPKKHKPSKMKYCKVCGIRH